MKRTTIFMEEAQQRDLDALAEREGRPKAELVREAIAEYLVGRGRRGELPGFVAAGASGERDGAEGHEELLFNQLEPHGDLGD